MAQFSNYTPPYQPPIQNIPGILRLCPSPSSLAKETAQEFIRVCVHSFVHLLAYTCSIDQVPAMSQPWVGHWGHFQGLEMNETPSLAPQGLDSSRRDRKEISDLRVTCQSSGLSQVRYEETLILVRGIDTGRRREGNRINTLKGRLEHLCILGPANRYI